MSKGMVDKAQERWADYSETDFLPVIKIISRENRVVGYLYEASAADATLMLSAPEMLQLLQDCDKTSQGVHSAAWAERKRNLFQKLGVAL